MPPSKLFKLYCSACTEYISLVIETLKDLSHTSYQELLQRDGYASSRDMEFKKVLEEVDRRVLESVNKPFRLKYTTKDNKPVEITDFNSCAEVYRSELEFTSASGMVLLDQVDERALFKQFENHLTKKKEEEIPVCPKCSSFNVLPIIYGHPTLILPARGRHERFLLEREIVLGGCCIRPDSPVWHCKNCSNEWGEHPEGHRGRYRPAINITRGIYWPFSPHTTPKKRTDPRPLP